MGGNMGLATPYVENPGDPPPPNEFPFFAVNQLDSTYVNGQRVTMTVDGMAVPFGVGIELWASGWAAPCPDNDCGPRWHLGRNDRPELTTPVEYRDGQIG